MYIRLYHALRVSVMDRVFLDLFKRTRDSAKLYQQRCSNNINRGPGSLVSFSPRFEHCYNVLWEIDGNILTS